jgi:carbamoyl-phosphate synthase small subunit
MKVSIYLENGLFFQGESFGAEGTAVGEIVFNTSLTGYQEIISDPSYAGQFITFTTTEIGNVGINSQDMESKSSSTKGIIVRSYNDFYSNFRAKNSLSSFLKSQNIMGISDVDTRFLTKTLRNEGAMMMIASTEFHDKDKLKKILENSPRIEDINYIDEVSTKEKFIHKQTRFDFKNFDYGELQEVKAKIIAVDFGVKQNILNELASAELKRKSSQTQLILNILLINFKAEKFKEFFCQTVRATH